MKDKYKIQKKVREHRRKLNKASKKNPLNKKVKKDPGIPNLWPFKEKLIREAEMQKESQESQRQRLREQVCVVCVCVYAAVMCVIKCDAQ